MRPLDKVAKPVSRSRHPQSHADSMAKNKSSVISICWIVWKKKSNFSQLLNRILSSSLKGKGIRLTFSCFEMDWIKSSRVLCDGAVTPTGETRPRWDLITDLILFIWFLGYAIINACYVKQLCVNGGGHLWITFQCLLQLSLQLSSFWCLSNQRTRSTREGAEMKCVPERRRRVVASIVVWM